MGITGLIPFLEKASGKVTLQDIRGSTVAIDSYCWLHKGVFGCAERLARGQDDNAYINYCLKYVMLLLHYDIKPIMVFDGQHLPAKAQTEKRRRELRQQCKKRAMELLRIGQTEEARSHLRRCIDVTHEMALRLIQECRKLNVDCIVAPYEADAQMAWFTKMDIAQYVITEDSDLMLFGARKVIFKLDLNGCGLLIEADKLHIAMGCHPDKYSFEKFRRMCILSGCDYLDSLPGIGLAKACKFIMKTEQDDMWKVLKRMPQYLNMRNLEVPDEYIENFLKAEATFRHMLIYNPLTRQQERLNAISDYGTDERYCCNAGELITDTEEALQLALGNVNPFTKKKMDNWQPNGSQAMTRESFSGRKLSSAKHKSIWQPNFKQHAVTNASVKSDSCAFYFKKIDVNKRALKDEMAAYVEQENSKLQETDVLSLYSSSSKRGRSNSTESSDSIDIEHPPPPPSPAKVNPFAKRTSLAAADPPKSPVVCKSASLLGLLSPSKANDQRRAEGGLASAASRNIFATTSVNDVLVRSRFFASNQTEFQVSQQQETPSERLQTSASSDLSAEMDDIESEAARLQSLQAALYSPTAKSKSTLTPANANETIHIIDDDDENEVRNGRTPPNSQTSIIARKLDDFQLRQPQRLGLSKSRKPTKVLNRNKSVTSKAAIDQSQTRLSMYGFKKRAVLK